MGRVVPPQNENGLKGGFAHQAIHEYFLNQKCVCKPTRAIARFNARSRRVQVSRGRSSRSGMAVARSCRFFLFVPFLRGANPLPARRIHVDRKSGASHCHSMRVHSRFICSVYQGVRQQAFEKPASKGRDSSLNDCPAGLCANRTGFVDAMRNAENADTRIDPMVNPRFGPRRTKRTFTPVI
ncbi:hypothetical protein OKW28_002465 [Paraburkholderia sp. 40]